MMRIKTFLFSLRGKAIIAATLFVVAFMGLIGYAVLSREKALYLKERENQARVLVETAGINYTNAILYQEVGLTEERGNILEELTPLIVGSKRIATLRIEFSLKDFYGKLTDLGNRIFLLTIAAISGSTFLLVLGINAMVRPIRRLSKAMDSIDYGKYDNISDAPRRDEI